MLTTGTMIILQTYTILWTSILLITFYISLIYPIYKFFLNIDNYYVLVNNTNKMGSN